MSDLPPLPPIAEEAALTGRVARGAAWIFGGGMFARLLGAVNTIVVARLLVPDDIGLVAVAIVSMQLLQGISDIGVAQAVVRFRDADRADLDTLFTLSALRGLAIGLVLAAAAPVMAVVYNDPRMLGVFLGVAAFPVFSGLINPRFYEFERDLNFSREFISTVANKLAGVIVSISIAVIFRTYWAIILGLIAGSIVQLILSYAMRPFVPRIGFQSLRKVFGFSGWLAGVSFLAALNNKLDVPILARLVGGGGAGVFFMGLQLSEMAAGQVARPLTRALYPGLSTLQDEPERMRRAYLRGVGALGAVAMPAAFGVAFVANDLVFLLLGEKWLGAVMVIEILAPVIGLQSLFYATQSYAMALGLTRLIFIRELIYLVVRLPIFIWATMAYGLPGAVWAGAGLGVFHVGLNLALYARASGRSFWQPLASAHRSLGAVAVMALYFLSLRPSLAGLADMAPALRLAADIVAGAGVYIGAHTALWLAQGRPDGVERDIADEIGRRFQK
ncbi:MAG: oligosaccharide flippase family protein [Alphaproteobacteria bacterium]|nr:oligosaccharide flippase family protein [Alphaproteobacteria bacterium]